MNDVELGALAARLAPHYSRFRVTERVLLTGHSHQAWPDVGFDGQQQAWLEAAEHVDDKWDHAFARALRVKQFYCTLLEDNDPGNYTLASNTHELVVRVLSSLDLVDRPRIVTTDGEFHSMRRQLDRLAEAGVEVVKVPAEPLRSLVERLAEAATGDTAAVMVSAVMFRDSRIVPHLAELAPRLPDDTVLLVDAYHALNVLPFSLAGQGLEEAFVVGGGYKYCQFGEGNCFLRVPPGCRLRPVVTGWYAEFGELESGVTAGRTPYVVGGDRFQGSTYDPTSHYRAAHVADFFEAEGLEPELLRRVSQWQLGRLCRGFDALAVDPALIRRETIPLAEVGGFLALRSPLASEISARLKAAGVHTDYREDRLRLGPAPYVSAEQLDRAMAILGEVVAELSRSAAR